MPSGGTLTVATRAVPDEPATRALELTIADTGEGIAEENLSKIFDPFFSTKEGGTGLGLALTQQIIIEHGGRIEVESRRGLGTRFVVRLTALPRGADVAVAPAVAR
jgi:signal transduction histidine kinase